MNCKTQLTTKKHQKQNTFSCSDLLNENEIYSCNQLEAFNSLPSVEKLKLQQAKNNNEQSVDQLDKVKVEIDVIAPNQIKAKEYFDKQNQQQQLLTTASAITADRKANPKTVTASVFKTLPIGSKLLKGNGGINNQIVGGGATVSRAPQTVTASLIQPISSIKRDPNVRVQPTEKPIAEPSFVPRQTVVTASLFQPRATAPGTQQTKSFTNTENMNKSYLMFTNDFRQLTSEYR